MKIYLEIMRQLIMITWINSLAQILGCSTKYSNDSREEVSLDSDNNSSINDLEQDLYQMKNASRKPMKS